VKSISERSADDSLKGAAAVVLVLVEIPLCRFCSAESAWARFAASSASMRAARPQVQSLQARRRRLPFVGRHSGAVSWLLERLYYTKVAKWEMEM